MDEPDARIAVPFGAAAVRDRIDTGEAILEQLYDQYARALFRYALSLLGSAEDAVQEVFVRAAREHRRLRKVRNTKAYLFTATRNVAYTTLRSRHRRDELRQAMHAQFTSKSAGQLAQSEILRSAFADLPIEQREVLALHIYDGMTFKEIAELTGSPINTITSRYRYGIEKLRRALEGDQNG